MVPPSSSILESPCLVRYFHLDLPTGIVGGENGIVSDFQIAPFLNLHFLASNQKNTPHHHHHHRCRWCLFFRKNHIDKYCQPINGNLRGLILDAWNAMSSPDITWCNHHSLATVVPATNKGSFHHPKHMPRNDQKIREERGASIFLENFRWAQPHQHIQKPDKATTMPPRHVPPETIQDWVSNTKMPEQSQDCCLGRCVLGIHFLGLLSWGLVGRSQSGMWRACPWSKTMPRWQCNTCAQHKKLGQLHLIYTCLRINGRFI